MYIKCADCSLFCRLKNAEVKLEQAIQSVIKEIEEYGFVHDFQFSLLISMEFHAIFHFADVSS